MNNLSLNNRAHHIAEFLQIPVAEALTRLQAGFGANHVKVTEDFNRFHTNLLRDDDALLEWYQRTDAYIFELTAYHLDEGFNYYGMCRGIADRLDTENTEAIKIDKALVLGDGIGDLTIYLIERGFDAIYHDLAGSRTAAYAAFHFFKQTGRGDFPNLNTAGWAPEGFPPGHFDAVVCCDFLEHVTDVEAWVRAIEATLRPGGLFMAQNAFAIGDDEHGGDMPMHLTRNNRFETDWDPLLDSLDMVKLSDNWRRKPSYVRVAIDDAPAALAKLGATDQELQELADATNNPHVIATLSTGEQVSGKLDGDTGVVKLDPDSEVFGVGSGLGSRADLTIFDEIETFEIHQEPERVLEDSELDDRSGLAAVRQAEESGIAFEQAKAKIHRLFEEEKQRLALTALKPGLIALGAEIRPSAETDFGVKFAYAVFVSKKNEAAAKQLIKDTLNREPSSQGKHKGKIFLAYDCGIEHTLQTSFCETCLKLKQAFGEETQA